MTIVFMLQITDTTAVFIRSHVVVVFTDHLLLIWYACKFSSEDLLFVCLVFFFLYDTYFNVFLVHFYNSYMFLCSFLFSFQLYGGFVLTHSCTHTCIPNQLSYSWDSCICLFVLHNANTISLIQKMVKLSQLFGRTEACCITLNRGISKLLVSFLFTT